MKKILIFTGPEGHLSIAQSIAAGLKKNYQVKLILPNKNTQAFYTPFYRYFPFLFKVPYRLSYQETIQKGAQIFANTWLEKQVKFEIKSFKPDIIISCWLFFNPPIEKVLDYQKQSIPFIHVLTNPWNIHPLEVPRQATYQLVYDNRSAWVIKKHKINKNTILPFGWFVRPEFYQKHDLTKIRKSLGFKKNIFTLLLCGGSEGSNLILKILPGLLNLSKPLQLILISGTNKTLFKAGLALKKVLPRLKKMMNGNNHKNCINIKVFTFSHELAQFMAISDLVVGKSGPNLLFETVASAKPFFGVCHISGQEDDNLKIISKKHLGIIEENPIKAMRLIKEVIEYPNKLQKYQQNIIKERNFNRQAVTRLHKLIKQLFLNQ